MARSGRVAFSSERTFWIHANRRRDFEAAADLIDSLIERYPRLEFLITTPEAATRSWLREAYPRAIVLPPPLPLRYFANRYFVNLTIRGMMFLGDLEPGDRYILRTANRRVIPAVIVQTPPPGAAETDASALGAGPDFFDHHFVVTRAALTRLTAAGIAAERITLLGSPPAERLAAYMAVVSQMLMQDLKLNRSNLRPLRRRLERLALWCMDQPRLRRLLSARVERIDSIADLRQTLGNPGTILCLGNGPSSEGPQVAAVEHDCLFRVNHVWLNRGFLTEPDMVFTGSKGTLSSVLGAIFGLQSIKSEARLLITRFLLPPFRRIRYVTIERFGLYLSEPRWQGIRPTNGAAMLATAVALQPPRLVIAGIDLFSHPAGSYPGDTATPNAYSPGHEAESELALLMAALSLFQGELVILSPALQERWDEHRRGRQAL